MTLSSSNDNSPPQVPSSLPTKAGKGRWLWVLVSRLFLLTVGAGLAGSFGVLAATFYPNPRPHRPWLGGWVHRSDRSLGGNGQMPFAQPVDSGTEGSVSAGNQFGAVAGGDLSAAQAQALRVEFQQLQAELKALRDRTTALEAQIGDPKTAELIETRLQTIAQYLAAQGKTETGETTAALPSANRAAVSDRNLITLPSDLLFQQGQSALNPDSTVILDTVIASLQPYQGAAIRIATHTDDTGNPAANLDLSFQRSQAIGQYLSNALGERYHWVIVGYGKTRPLVDSNTEADRQRNRRVEIAID